MKSVGLAFLFLMAVSAASVRGQSSCTSVLISLSPCLNYISGNSSSPSPSCCQQLANVVSSQPRCLCQVLNGSGPSLGVSINQTRAMALPTACKIQTPPVSRCNNAGGTPTTSPTTGGSSGDGNAKADSPSSTNVPATGDGSSDAYHMKLSFGLMVVLLFTSSYACFHL